MIACLDDADPVDDLADRLAITLLLITMCSWWTR